MKQFGWICVIMLGMILVDFIFIPANFADETRGRNNQTKQSGEIIG
ncbi:MAG: hypothetical protein LBU34_12365 [Planctomycetaceae bacterium]|jgi:hypothetical protein|nr:hypothetical protein [Planctomycetaceae bacterium]